MTNNVKSNFGQMIALQNIYNYICISAIRKLHTIFDTSGASIEELSYTLDY